MAKNDYRRSLLMLRGLEKGYSGHARLERRVLSGTLDFNVTSPAQGETLEAALIGPRGGRLVAKALGQLKSDSRDRRGLLAAFDPRNISGMDLDEVTAAVIARVENNRVRPVLCGWINGSKPINWAEVERILEELFGSQYIKPPEEQPTQPEDITTPSEEIATQPEDTTTPPEEMITQPDEISTQPDENTTQLENVPTQPEEDTTRLGEESTQPEEDTTLPDEISTQLEEQPIQPAGALLNIDMSRPWHEDIESLRILFLTSPAYSPFEMEGYVFVRAGMAEETGIDHCAVGVRAENGQIVGVCYAIPMPYTASPPAGLENYTWIGDDNRGWWVTCDTVGSTD